MIKQTIADTPYGTSLELRKRSIEAASFLAKNQDFILGSDGIEYVQSAVRPTVSTPLVEIYNKVAEQGKLRYFTMLDLSRATDVPTLLTLKDVVIDGKYISQNMPKAFQNVWFNLTPILSRRDAYNRNLLITDQIDFANQIARGMFCMSYNDSDAWFTPSICAQIVDVYSLLISSYFRMRYNLDLNDMSIVRVLFAAYMAQMLGRPEDRTLEIPPLLNRYELLKLLIPGNATPRALSEVFEKFKDARNAIAPDNILNLDTCCQILNKVGPGRISGVTGKALSIVLSRSPMDNQNMLFAIDYPPYFVWLLLQNLKGGKNPMIQNLFKVGDTKRRVATLADEIVNCKLFIDKVTR